jgi:hypothetical protein
MFCRECVECAETGKMIKINKQGRRGAGDVVFSGAMLWNPHGGRRMTAYAYDF